MKVQGLWDPERVAVTDTPPGGSTHPAELRLPGPNPSHLSLPPPATAARAPPQCVRVSVCVSGVFACLPGVCHIWPVNIGTIQHRHIHTPNMPRWCV